MAAALVRLTALGRESLWLDEAISYLAAQLPLEQIASNTVQSSHPPLYYLLLHFWLRLVPNADTAVKLLSTIFGIALIPATYWLCQLLFGNRTVSLTTATLTAISPFHILYSHELRMYTLVMLLVVLGTAVYWQARQRSSSGWWLVAGLLFLLAVYTHLFAFLALAGVGLHALLEIRHNRHAFWATAVMAAVILLCFVPWLRLILAEAEPALGSLRPLQQATEFNPLKPITAPVFLLFGMSGSFWFSGSILFVFFAYFIIFLLELRKLGLKQISSDNKKRNTELHRENTESHRDKREKSAAGIKLILLIIVCVLGVPLLVYAIRPFFLPERTLAVASPFLIILFAWGVTRRQSPLPFLTGLAALLMLVSSLLYLTGDLIKPPYRAATAFVAERATAADRILHTSDGSYLPALRYTPQLNQGMLAGDPDPRKPVAVYEALGGEVWSLEEVAQPPNACAEPGQSGRLWLIVALEHSIEWQQSQVEAITTKWPVLEETDIGGIRIYQLGQGQP